MCNVNISKMMILWKLSHTNKGSLCIDPVTELHLDLSNYPLYGSPRNSSASKTSASKNESLLAQRAFSQHSRICLVVLFLCKMVVVVVKIGQKISSQMKCAFPRIFLPVSPHTRLEEPRVEIHIKHCLKADCHTIRKLR